MEKSLAFTMDFYLTLRYLDVIKKPYLEGNDKFLRNQNLQISCLLTLYNVKYSIKYSTKISIEIC